MKININGDILLLIGNKEATFLFHSLSKSIKKDDNYYNFNSFTHGIKKWKEKEKYDSNT